MTSFSVESTVTDGGRCSSSLFLRRIEQKSLSRTGPIRRVLKISVFFLLCCSESTPSSVQYSLPSYLVRMNSTAHKL